MRGVRSRGERPVWADGVPRTTRLLVSRREGENLDSDRRKEERVRKRIALITGGTSGVGLSILPDLVKAGFHVLFVGTNDEKGRDIEVELNASDPSASTFVKLNLSDLRAVRDFAQQFRIDYPALDLLLNVAGAMFPERRVTEEGFETTFAIGYLSAFVLCRELAPSLANVNHSRVVNVAGLPRLVLNPALDFENLDFKKNYKGMRVAITTVHAKTVLTEILAERLREQNIDVNSFHPGAVKGDVGRNMTFPMNAVFAVANLFMASKSTSGIHLSTAKEVRGVTGHLFVGKKSTPLHFDSEYKAQLWRQTERMLAEASI